MEGHCRKVFELYPLKSSSYPMYWGYNFDFIPWDSCFSGYSSPAPRRAGKLVYHRTLDFHVHENSNEMFYCIEGEFDIEFEDGLSHLREGDFIIIPKGIKHRPVCKGVVKCLLIETNGTLNKENTGGTYSE